MNSKPSQSRAASRPCALVRKALFTSLLTVTPLAAIADPHVATSSQSRVADVLLADLDLSTPGGMRAARDRLLVMARGICATPGDNPDLLNQANFAACVDNTVMNALQQVEALKRTNVTVRNSVTSAANVSIADLDISTPEGLRAAQGRLRKVARSLCVELAQRADLSYRPSFDACVHDTVTGALDQVIALREIKQSRAAQRTEP